MTITQENLLQQIAEKGDINIATVRLVFKTAEAVIFGRLSSTTPEENTIVKVMDGLSLEGTYVPEKQIHTYDHITCRPRIRVKPKVTRHYNRKVNGYFDEI